MQLCGFMTKSLHFARLGKYECGIRKLLNSLSNHAKPAYPKAFKNAKI